MNISHCNVFDDDAITGRAGRAAVQIVLLNVDAVVGYVAQGDVSIGNAVPHDQFQRDRGKGVWEGGKLPCDIAGGVVVGLDASTVLAVQNDAVLEQDIRDIVVRLSTNAANAQTVAAVAVHSADSNAVS